MTEISVTGTKSSLKKRRTLLCLLGLACAAGLLLWLWLSGAFLAEWHNKLAQADVNADGVADTLTLHERKLQTADTNGNVLWSTEAEWLVEDFLLGDIDRDGEEELLVLLWRRGSYGEKRPFWITQDEKSYSQHIFIYKLDGGLHCIWGSSRLRPEVARWEMSVPGELNILTDKGEETCWSWVSWGLERIDGGTIEI